jgi:hypothetical protein
MTKSAPNNISEEKSCEEQPATVPYQPYESASEQTESTTPGVLAREAFTQQSKLFAPLALTDELPTEIKDTKLAPESKSKHDAVKPLFKSTNATISKMDTDPVLKDEVREYGDHAFEVQAWGKGARRLAASIKKEVAEQEVSQKRQMKRKLENEPSDRGLVKKLRIA